MEAGQLQTEAQDVCHQLLDGPFRECHAQMWVGWRWCLALAQEGPEGGSVRKVPKGEPGSATRLLCAVGQATVLAVLGFIFGK